ncbi:hypothetical protein HZC07_05035, partial [Candidatus Micrarchaeota archaeon]|nr:hypothetical protein [Candidatus Micrarchaeota archaeon]
MAERNLEAQWSDNELLPEQVEVMRNFNREKELTGMAHNTRWGYLVALRTLGKI